MVLAGICLFCRPLDGAKCSLTAKTKQKNRDETLLETIEDYD